MLLTIINPTLIPILLMIHKTGLVNGFGSHEEFYRSIALMKGPTSSLLVNSLWNETKSMLSDGIINQECHDDIMKFQKGVLQGEKWALQMLDSSSHLQSGYLAGNIVNYGDYDECLAIGDDSNGSDPEGQYCTVEFSLRIRDRVDSNKYTAIYQLPTLAICLPSSCKEGQLSVLLKNHLKKDIAISCVKKSETLVKHATSQYLFISLFVAITILVVAGSVYDFCIVDRRSIVYKQHVEDKVLGVLLSFSVVSNGKRLLEKDTRDGSIKCIHGLRFLAACGIVVVHRNLSDKQPFTNYFAVDDEITKWYHTFIMNAYLCVDIFFLISGLLISYSFLNRKRDTFGFRPFSLFLHRYIRLTPTLAVVIMMALLLDFVCQGYHCHTVIITYEQKNCQDYWYYTLLYVNNLIDVSTKCLPHTWYLTADMHLFVASFLLLYIMTHKQSLKYILTILTVLLMMSTATIFYLSYKHNLKTIPIGKNSMLVKEAAYVYEPFYTRAGPWLIGFGLGPIINHFNTRSFKIMKIFVALGWLVAIALIICASLGMYPYMQYHFEHGQIHEYVYKSVYRNIWAFGFAWIIFACCTKHGGFINSFLSSHVFHPLSRLTYCLYLIHPIVQQLEFGDQMHPRQFSDKSQITIYVGDIFYSSLMAVVLHLAIEAPVSRLENLFRTKEGKKYNLQNNQASRLEEIVHET